MDDCLDFDSDQTMVVAARRFVGDRLRSWGAADYLDDALLIVSELATNVVLHAHTPARLRLQLRGRVVRIEVHDTDPRLPVLAPCPPEATSGRGLALITYLASAWGMERCEDGKVVWAELGSSPLAPRHPWR